MVALVPLRPARASVNVYLSIQEALVHSVKQENTRIQQAVNHASHARRICTLGRGEVLIMVVMNQCHTIRVIVTQVIRKTNKTGNMDARRVLRITLELLIN